MDTLGKLVRERRIARGETFKQLGRALKCSEAFAHHIEASRLVPISKRLIDGLKKHYRIPVAQLEKAAATRSRIGRAYYRSYRISHGKVA